MIETAPDYRFWAFISYSSKDAAVAKKLHKALETYSIPRDLRGRPGRDGTVPTKLFPIFRDRDELPLASDLGSTIEDALKASRYLIVLCSQRSAQSRWVNEEIRLFKKMGREDRILALIIDGEPSGSNTPGKEAEECFPEALRFKVTPEGEITDEPTEPIAGDLRKGGDGWQVSFLKAMAGITGLGYNAFAQREKKRRRVRQAVAGTVLAGLLGGGLYTWDYLRVKTHYYEGFVLRYGVPEGIGEVPDDHLSKRSMTLKIEESRRKVRRIQAINSKGRPGELALVDASYIDGAEFGFPSRVSKVEVEYREDGGVALHKFYDFVGRPQMQHVYSQDQKSVELRSAAGEAAQTMNADFGSLSRRGSGSSLGQAADTGKTEIARWTVVYDSSGFVVEKSYGNAWGSPTADQDGKATIRYTRATDGRVLAESALTLDGQPVVEVGSQVASSKQTFDERSRLISSSFLDGNGQPVTGPLGYAAETLEYDAFGNVASRIFRDKDGKPVKRMDGFSIFRAFYSPDGVCISKRYFDTEEKPVIVPGFGAHEFRYVANDKGLATETSCYDDKGAPVVGKDGYHRLLSEYDERGFCIRTRVLDAKNEPMLHANEFWHRQDYKYDERGNYVENSIWDTHDNPILGKDGVHRTVWTYDRLNRAVSWKSYGIDDKPCLSTDSTHTGKIAYDNRGNISSWTFFGTQGEPVLNASGNHIYKQVFDEKGSLLEYSHWGSQEEPVLEKESRIHRVKYTYNERGQLSEKRIFGLNGEPAYDPGTGYHLLKKQYDKAGNLARESYFDTHGKPVNSRKEGYHARALEYDARGNVLVEEYYGTDGKKTVSSDGFQRLTQTFDEFGNETSESYFGIRGEPVIRLAVGIHSYRRKYDEAGRLVLESYFDASGKSFPMKDQSYHQVKNAYDADGRLESVTYLDGENRPVELGKFGYTMVRMTYDERGQVLTKSFFDRRLKPMVTFDERFHKVVNRYDAFGHTIETRYFGKDGQPVEIRSGYHLYRAQYDARGMLAVRTFFDVNEKPVISKVLLAHRVTQVCDNRGNVLEEAYFDTNDKPTFSSSKIHIVRQEFDDRGNELVESYYGARREPIAPDGIHALKQTYDGFDQVTETAWFGVNDEPVENDQGFHRKETRYDPNGNAIFTAYYAKDGKPAVKLDEGLYRILRKYNSRNQLVEISYQDGDGQPMMSPSGFARQTMSYDARGNLSEIEFFGVSGERVAVSGAARRVGHYDQRTNQLLEVLDYDLDGNLIATP
ncbi:MAG: TIR domain-containing protein [Luteolibacter sp.]